MYLIPHTVTTLLAPLTNKAIKNPTMPYDKWGRVGYCGIYWEYVLAFTTVSAKERKKIGAESLAYIPLFLYGDYLIVG